MRHKTSLHYQKLYLPNKKEIIQIVHTHRHLIHA